MSARGNTNSPAATNDAVPETKPVIVAVHSEDAVDNSTPGANDSKGVFAKAKHDFIMSARAVAQHRTLFLWCLYVQLFLVSYGFEIKMTGLIVAFPEFRKDYGHPFKGQYVLSALWQSLWAAGAQIGLVLGSLLCGLTLDRFGRKIPLMSALFFSIATTVLMVVSPTLQILFAAKLLFGIASGTTLTVAPLYLAENTPTELRGPVVSLINLFIVLGQFLASAVAKGTQDIAGPWSYKGSFALTALFPITLCLTVYWMPESPAWLIARNREEDARKALQRLHGAHKSHTFDEIISVTMHNLHHETDEKPSFRDCFRKGHHRERTIIASLILSMQPLCGMPFILPYQTYFYQLSGMTRSFSIALGSTGAMLVACIIASLLCEVVGRRRIIIWVVAGIMVWNCIIGFTALAPASNRQAAVTTVGFVASWPVLYQISLGSVGWAIASEIQTQRLRAKTMAFANIVAQFWFWIVSFTVPYMLNPDQANLGGKITLVYFGLLLGPYVYCFFRLPETSGRSFQELDELYMRRISPRQFAKTPAGALREDAGKGEMS